MKKILYFITQSEFGGAQRYVFDLANNLKNDYQVAVAMGEQGINGKLAKILHENDIKYYIIPHLKRSISPINELLALREIIKLINQFKPDIIHLNSSKISILGSLAALFTKSKIENRKSKIVYTVHGWVFNEPLPAWLKYFYLCAEKITARWKDKIICVSELDRQAALKRKIAPANKLVAIHNGLEPIEFYSREDARKILQSQLSTFNFQLSTLWIGSVGNLYKTKGFAYFIEGAGRLAADLPAARFIIIGEGHERKNLEKLIAKYNLQNNFILAGQIDEAAKLLPALDIFVCSSVKEGFPYSILEAMQAGLPVVSTKVGGIPEMIENNKTGLLAMPVSSKDLAEKIKTLLNNKTLAVEQGARAKAKARTEFTLEKMVAATKKLY